METDNEKGTESVRDVLLEGLVTLSTTPLLIKTNIENLMYHLSSFTTGKIS